MDYDLLKGSNFRVYLFVGDTSASVYLGEPAQAWIAVGWILVPSGQYFCHRDVQLLTSESITNENISEDKVTLLLSPCYRFPLKPF